MGDVSIGLYSVQGAALEDYLRAYSVKGAMVESYLKVYSVKGAAVLSEDDDWEEPDTWAKYMYGCYPYSTGWSCSDNTARCYICRLEKNKTYRIKRNKKSYRMRIATYDTNIFRWPPDYEMELTWSSFESKDNNTSTLEFDVFMGEAQYLVVYYTASAEDVEITVEEIIKEADKI